MRPTTYSPTAKVLHWLVFALIVAQLVLGWLMPGARRTTPPDVINNWHMSIGVITLAVIAVRTAWRIVSGPPEPEPGPHWQVTAAHWTHVFLYASIFAIVFSGWASAVAHNWTVTLFWSVTLPSVLPAGAAWVHAVGELHSALVWVMLSLVGLHAAAALGHHYILGDNVLRRILPSRVAERI